MGRIFRAFVWLRWRVLMNSLERTGSRDTLERFSVAVEKLAPIVALTLLIPSSIGLLVLGLTAGFGVATGSWVLPLEFVRFFLLLVLALTLVGPMVLPTRDGGNAIRLLLLPIPRAVLFTAQSMGALADPWIFLTLPILIGVPIGLATGLRFGAALLAAAAGLALLLVIVGLTSLASSVIHLLLRDRRRGELVMLVFIIVLPLLGIFPQFLIRAERQNDRKLTRAERRALPPTRAETIIRRAAPYVPSEAYRHATRNAVSRPAGAVQPIGVLAIAALAVQAAAFAAFRRVLDMPMTSGIRRAGSFGGLWNRVIPGLSPAASAVAFTQLRMALRSPRGRASMFTPLLMPLLLAGMIYKRLFNAPFAAYSMSPGLALAAFAALASILALLQIAMNQFAIDKAGFTRLMLSPLSLKEVLAGKSVGNALIAAIPAVFCYVVFALFLPGGSLALWVALPIAFVATYCLFAPVAAALSAIFPKTADLNSIGSAGNAHQAAGMLGLLTLVVSVAPSLLLTFLGLRILRRPDFVPMLLLGWCATAFGISRLLFVPVRRLVANRVETLAQYY